jgi:hypothetical protein
LRRKADENRKSYIIPETSGDPVTKKDTREMADFKPQFVCFPNTFLSAGGWEIMVRPFTISRHKSEESEFYRKS